MKQITGGVTRKDKRFSGDKYSGKGIKYKDRKDMAMIYSEVPCKAKRNFYDQYRKSDSGQMGSQCGIQQQSGTGGCHQCRNCQCLHRRGRHGLL